MVGNRERLMDDLSLMLPVLGRELGKSWTKQGIDVEEITGCSMVGSFSGSVSPGHVQVLIALSGGARSVGAIAEEIGVSSPAVTQLVDRLVEQGIAVRRPDERDRRVVLVDFAEEAQELARTIIGAYRSHLEDLVSNMDDDEIKAFLKGIRLLIDGAGNLEDSIREISIRENSGGSV